MFGKKKETQIKQAKQIQAVVQNYSSWEQDLGFLSLILNRVKETNKTFLINTKSEQLSDDDFLKDSDLDNMLEKSINEVMNLLSDNYIMFLVTKYFKNVEALQNFISDTIYIDMIDSAVKENNTKISKKYRNVLTKAVIELNKKNPK